ncbi:MAG: DsbA family protein [Nanoarchaeota archaeon]|nr:DsbA family protein [Nanoarchaeota archaeon]
MDNEDAKEEKPATPMIGEKKQGNKNHVLYGVVAVLAVILCVALFTGKIGFLTGKAVSGDKASVEFYVMSQCPYGTQVIDAIAPVLEKMGDAVDFSIDFIGGANPDGTFTSLHGQPEVDENIRQLCAMRIAPDKYMDYILCQNKNIRNAAANADTCAAEAGIDASELNACFEGNEGKQLLTESFAKADAVGAMGSPTIYVNGNAYNGGRDALSFQEAICRYANWHDECSDIPECSADVDCTAELDKDGKCNAGKCEYSEPVAVEFIVLNDVKCGLQCDPTQVIEATNNIFKGVNQRNVDVNSDEGKKLVSELGIQKAPAYLFGASVTESFTWNTMPQIQGAFEKRGDWYKLLDAAVGANYPIDEEARKAYEAVFKPYQGGCEGLVKSAVPEITLFIESRCPYGTQTLNGAAPVASLLGKGVKIIPKYMVSVNGDTVSAMHGAEELEEDKKQVCIREEFEDELWTYLKCYAETGNTDSCLSSAGIDKGKLKECTGARAVGYLKNDGEEWANVYGPLCKGVSPNGCGSPSIFVNGNPVNEFQEVFGGRSPESIKKIACCAMDKQDNSCSSSLSSEQPPVGFGVIGASTAVATTNGGGCGV